MSGRRAVSGRLALATIAGMALGSTPSAGATTPTDVQPTDIVVVATSGKCRIVRAGVVMGDREMRDLSNGWPPDRPLRVVEPRGADRKCLTRIVLDLEKQGFRSIVFIDPPAGR